MLAEDGAAAQPATDVVSVHHFWRIPGQPAAVIKWLDAHPPAGSSLFTSGRAGDKRQTVEWFSSFLFAPVPGAIEERGLDVSVSAARGGGTARRPDGWARWLIPRPASEVVPADVTTVQVGYETGSPTTPKHVRTITDPATIAKLVALVDGLQIQQPAPVICPAILVGEPMLDIAFLGPHGGRPLARAVEDGCDHLDLWIDDRAAAPLQEPSGLADLLRHLRALPTPLAPAGPARIS
jgi:hypothetical protein